MNAVYHSHFNEDTIEVLREAFDPTGTLETDLLEMWPILQAGVEQDVRSFWSTLR